MTYIPVDFDSVVEPIAAAAGRYDLQITGCDVTKTGPNSKSPGSPQLKATIGFTDDSNTPNIQQYISLPNENDEKSSADFKVLLLKRFLELFKVPYDKAGIDPEKLAMEMVGCTANAEVGQTEPNPDNGAVYNRLVVPKIKGEPDSRGKGTPPKRR